MRTLATMIIIAMAAAACGEPIPAGLHVDRPAVEAADPAPACCYCLEGGLWECEAWPDGAEACIAWGYELDVTVSWDPDCPEAATESTLDDVACVASCA